MLAAMGRSDMPEPLARYGIGVAVVAFMAGVLGSAILGGLYASISGEAVDSYGVSIASLTGLWVGTLGVAIFASRKWGSRDWRRDYAVAIDWRRDVGLGVVVGAASQLVMVPLIVLFFRLIQPSLKLSEASVDLAKKSHGVAFAVLAVLVSVVAPFVEEVFFRGLLMRSLARRMPDAGAVVLSGVIFGFAHYQSASAAAAAALVISLSAFGCLLGILVLRTGRLGPAIVAHMVFNAIATVGLYADSVHRR
jgi:membrane protease YdiL (CAAX protease family)